VLFYADRHIFLSGSCSIYALLFKTTQGLGRALPSNRFFGMGIGAALGMFLVVRVDYFRF